MRGGRALQIRDVHLTWISMLGVSCQIRRELSSLFWKLNTIKLRPGTAGSLNSVAFGNIRKIYIEVVSPQRRVRKYAFTLSDFRTAVKTLLKLPSLQQIDTVIDVPSVLACLPTKGPSPCRRHGNEIGNLVQKFRKDLIRNWGGYYYFRLPVTQEARLQAYTQITQEFPSLSTSINLNLAFCPDHALGFCDEMICRLLHAIEELCQDPHGHPAECLFFFEHPSPATSTWTPNTTIWRLGNGDFPTIVDITDLRAKQPDSKSMVSNRLRRDDSLFKDMYLRKEDTDDEDESVVSQ